jgi:hypothetical protein
MKGTPLLLASMIIIMGSLLFAAYLLGEVAAQAGERNKAQLALIEKLVTDIRDCRQGPKTEVPLPFHEVTR